MTNYDIIKIVNLAINKDINGNAFSPDEYITMINAHSIRLFMQRLGLTSEYNGQPVAREGVSISKVNEMSLLPFQVIETLIPVNGLLDLTGKNIAYIGAVLPTTITGRGFSEIYPYQLGERLGDPITQPTSADPMLMWRTPVSMQIYPATITSISVIYYKYPTSANFTITPNPTTLLPVYTSIQELEWNDSDKVEIAYRIIREAGVNIERGDVVQYSNEVIKTGK